MSWHETRWREWHSAPYESEWLSLRPERHHLIGSPVMRLRARSPAVADDNLWCDTWIIGSIIIIINSITSIISSSSSSSSAASVQQWLQNRTLMLHLKVLQLHIIQMTCVCAAPSSAGVMVLIMWCSNSYKSCELSIRTTRRMTLITAECVTVLVFDASAIAYCNSSKCKHLYTNYGKLYIVKL